MLEGWSPRWRRLLNSLAYGALVASVIGLGYLTFAAVSARRDADSSTSEVPDEPSIPLVEFDGFSSRIERNADGERLAVTLRLRLTAPGTLDCFAFVIARNDHVQPKLWGVWPSKSEDGAVTAGGHFRGGTRSGEPITLGSTWYRLSAAITHPPGEPPFDTVMVYVVGPKGDILLARPFNI